MFLSWQKGTEMPLLVKQLQILQSLLVLYFCQNHFFQLNQLYLYPRKLVRCIPLHLCYRRERLRWCKEHIGWGHRQWSKVMFCDESRFTITSGSSHQLLWKERRLCTTAWCTTAFHANVLVWVGILHNVRHRFTIFSELTYHWNGNAERLFCIMLFF